MVRSDWRVWILSVKKENAGWIINQATKVVKYTEMKPGARCIPLGELFSVKRDGRYKFRQIAFGNMLRPGKIMARLSPVQFRLMACVGFSLLRAQLICRSSDRMLLWDIFKLIWRSQCTPTYLGIMSIACCLWKSWRCYGNNC